MNRSRHGTWLFLAWICLAICAPIARSQEAGDAPPVWLTQAQAQKDARELIRLLEDSHPDPYSAFGGRVAFKIAANELWRDMPKEGIARSELSQRFAAFMSRIKDGHTAIELALQITHLTVVPFRFSAGPQGLFLSAWNTPSLDGLMGARLLAIDDVSENELLAKSSRMRGTENEFNARAALRNCLRTLECLEIILGTPSRAKVVLQMKTPRGKVLSVPVQLPKPTDETSDEGWRKARPLWKQVIDSDEPFRYQFFDSHRVAYLVLDTTMPREAYEMQRGSGWGDLRADLDRYYRGLGKTAPEDIDRAIAGIPSLVEVGEALLREMKRHRTKYLIVGLEDNSGGVTSSARPLLYQIYGDASFAAQEQSSSTTLFSSLYLQKYHTDIEGMRHKEHRPDLQLGDFLTRQVRIMNTPEARNEWLAGMKAEGVSEVGRLERQAGEAIYHPPKVVVLSGVDTFSAAFHILANFRTLGAKIVGLPPGQSPNAFMEITPFTLPESRLAGSISNSAQIFTPENPQQRVFQPDFPITERVLARYGYDGHTALRYALDLIRSGRL